MSGAKRTPSALRLCLLITAVAVGGAGPSAAELLEDANPSTIQSALDNDCGSGCKLELPCGRYEVTDSPGADLIQITDLEHVLISGCGMNGTTIAWNVSPTQSGETSNLLVIDGTSRWITIEDVKLEINNLCDPAQYSDCDVWMTAASVLEDASDVTFERVHFHATKLDAHGSNPKPQALHVGSRTDPVARVSAYSSRFHSSGNGLVVAGCDDCWFSANWLGDMLLTGKQTGYALGDKSTGVGVRFINNTFDMNGEVPIGIYLRSTGTGVTSVHSSAQLVGNSFINLDEGRSGVIFYLYNRATVQGNFFACAGTGACDAFGVDTSALLCDDVGDCNRENLISGNVFERIIDDGSSCPVHIRGISGETTTTGNVDNFIHGNLFSLGSGSSSGADGICGDATKISANQISDNQAHEP